MLCIETIGAVRMEALNNCVSMREGLRAMLFSSVDVALSQRPGGCMLALGVANCLPENEAKLPAPV